MAAVSTHGRCLEAVHELIQKLDLEGIPASQVYKRKIVYDRNVTLPAVIVSHQGQEQPDGGTNARDDWGYPVSVALVIGENQDLAFEDNLLLWREKIRKAFHNNNRLIVAGITEHLRSAWEPHSIIDEAAFRDHNLFVSAMTIRVYCREGRTS